MLTIIICQRLKSLEVCHHLSVSIRHCVSDEHFVTIELKLVLEGELEVHPRLVRIQGVGLRLVRARIIGDVRSTGVLAPATLTFFEASVALG